jgi:mannose-6-phosphate isomerase-like protein (cupin superfamily)
MRRVEKPWGFELIWAETRAYAGKILHIYAGHCLSRQFHRTKEETLLVLQGELELEIGSKPPYTRRLLRAQETAHIPPGMVHRLIARSEVELAEVSTPELDDVVRLEDRYGRNGS